MVGHSYTLLCSHNPLLGVKGDDVISEITNLCSNNDEDIHKFYDQVVNIQEKLEFSTEIIKKTKLLEKYLQAMSKSIHHHHLLQYYIIELNLHTFQQGCGHSYPTVTIHAIYQHLSITNGPFHVQLEITKKYKPNISQFVSENTPGTMTQENKHQ